MFDSIDDLYAVQSRQDFVASAYKLHAKFEGYSGTRPWKNTSLPDYLEAFAAWTNDARVVAGRPMPQEPTWRLVALMPLAAASYE